MLGRRLIKVGLLNISVFTEEHLHLEERKRKEGKDGGGWANTRMSCWMFVLSHMETRVQMYRNTSSRTDWVAAEDKRSGKEWKRRLWEVLTLLLGGKAGYPFWKMNKTDAVSKDPFHRNSTNMSHVWKDQRCEGNCTFRTPAKEKPFLLTHLPHSPPHEKVKFPQGRNQNCRKFIFYSLCMKKKKIGGNGRGGGRWREVVRKVRDDKTTFPLFRRENAQVDFMPCSRISGGIKKKISRKGFTQRKK